MVGLGQGYWTAWQQFVDTVIEQGWVSEDDRLLYRVTNEVDAAGEEICGFYRNFHSLRYSGNSLVIRVQRSPSDLELEGLNRNFADLIETGAIVRSGPLRGEVADNDHLDLARLVLQARHRKPGRLRQFIDALNGF